MIKMRARTVAVIGVIAVLLVITERIKNRMNADLVTVHEDAVTLLSR